MLNRCTICTGGIFSRIRYSKKVSPPSPPKNYKLYSVIRTSNHNSECSVSREETVWTPQKPLLFTWQQCTWHGVVVSGLVSAAVATTTTGHGMVPTVQPRPATCLGLYYCCLSHCLESIHSTFPLALLLM